MGIVSLDGNGMMVRGIPGGLCVMDAVWEFYLVHCYAALQPLSPFCFSCSWFSSQEQSPVQAQGKADSPIHVLSCFCQDRAPVFRQVPGQHLLILVYGGIPEHSNRPCFCTVTVLEKSFFCGFFSH